MRLNDFKIIKPVAIIVLFFFCWTFCICEIPNAFANNKQAGKSSQQSAISNQSSQPKPQRPEERFQATINDIEQILADTSTDTDTKKNKLKGKKSDLESYDTEIRKNFSDTEKFLKEKNLPNEILNRHRDFVTRYDSNLAELKGNLDAIDKAKNKSEADAAISRAKAHLEKVKVPSKHTPLNPDKLPHRTAEPIFIEPRTSPPLLKGDSTGGSASEKSPTLAKGGKGGFSNNDSILVASNGSLDGLLTRNSELKTQNYLQLALADPPTDADLAETIEVQFTPAIRAKAEELGRNPVKIYNWVRNNIEYVPTYGSIQGADMCLQTKQCNDFDTASLLIALLRASGIYARYVQGTIELPIEKVKNWVGGFTDTNAALTLIASGGIPVTGLTSGGSVQSVRMEHTWVEAWIDYIPSRGEIHRVGDTWIPLDASFKQYSYTQGIDIKSAVPFDAQTFINQLKSTATINDIEGYATNLNSLFIRQTMQDYQTQVQNYLVQNYPNSTLGEVFGKKEIIRQEFSMLAGTLPYKRTVIGAKYSNIPDNLRHKITFSINNDNLYYDSQPLIKTKSLPELAGKRITINYLPTSDMDADVLAKYGYYSAPPYLVNLKPVLFIEGVQEAAGGSIGMGTSQSLQISFTSPGKSSDNVSHPLNASAMVSIGLDIQRITPGLLEERKAKLDSALSKLGVAEVGFDDLIGEILNLHALSYFLMNEMYNKFAALGKIAYTKFTAEMAVMINPSVEYLYGVPYRISEPNLEIDVKRYIMARKSLNGDRAQEINYLLSTGLISSALEHGVVELLNEGGKGISAVKALSLANDNGIPVYRINATNSTSVLQKLQVSPETINNIRNAIAAGKEVIIPERSLQYYQWVGEGYIVFDPNTGAGDYLISGGLFGGSNVCNLYAKNNVFKGAIADYWKHGNYRTLSGGGTTEYCKNHVYELVDFFKQTKDALIRWAAKAEELDSTAAAALRAYAVTMGTIVGILMTLASNMDKLKQLNTQNSIFAVVFIASVTFLTMLAVTLGLEIGGPIGGPLLSVYLIVPSNIFIEEYLKWLLSMQQAALFDRRRERYVKNISIESEYPI